MKRTNRMISILLAAMMLLSMLTGFTLTVGAAGANLISNPSFEDGEQSGSWAAPEGSMEYDESFAHEGNASMKMVTGTAFAQTTYLNVVPHTDYRISGWMYVEKEEDLGKMFIDLWDCRGEVELYAKKAGEWQYVSGIWNSYTANSVRLRCVGLEGAVGAAWFDDLAIEQLDDATELENGSFEEDTEFWTSQQQSLIGVTSNKAHTGEKSMELMGRGGLLAIASSRKIAVEPNSYYEYSGYIYKETANGSAYLDMDDIAGEVQAGATKTGEWEKVSGKWFSAENTFVVLRMVCESTFDGGVWFDDIEFKKIDEAFSVDGSFETSTGWSMGIPASTFIDGVRPHEGSKSLHCSAAGTQIAIANSIAIPVEQNTDYIYSAYIYREDDSTWAYIDFNDAAYELQVRGSKVGEWEKVTGIWNSGSNESISLRTVVEGNHTTGTAIAGDVFFDDITFEKADPQTTGLVNGSFELMGEDGAANAYGWTGMSSPADAMVVDNTRAFDGEYAFHSRVRETGLGIAYSKLFSVKPNTDYMVSCRIYRDDTSGWTYVDMCDAPGEVELKATKSGEWELISKLWNSGDNTSIMMRVVNEKNWENVSEDYTGVTGDSWIDDITLTEVSYDAYDETSPVLSKNAEKFTLSSKDTAMEFALDGNKLYATSLKNIADGTQWLSGAAEIPLVSVIDDNDVEWIFDSKTIEAKKLTFNFKSTDGAFEYKVEMEAPAGEGPVYYVGYLTNKSGKIINIRDNNVYSADMILNVPQNTTLYRFNRSRMNNGMDADFYKGVLTTDINTDLFLRSTVEDNWRTNNGTLPLHMLSNGNFGMYYAYNWGYGKIISRTQKDATKLRTMVVLNETAAETPREDGEVYEVPGMYFGTYNGSLDNGSNLFKRWFYDNKMTATLRENANEPLVELHTPANSEEEWAEVLEKDYASWGVQLIKQDYWWTVDTLPSSPNSGFDAYKEQQWEPDPGRWPNGMTLGKMVHDKGMQLSLYMCDTYKGVDIGTKEGRQIQIDALSERIENWGVDYWRSDFECVNPDDYDSFEGLNYVLDTLIAKYPQFRYENCSAGGAHKNLKSYERLTVQTFEDTGNALNHRMSFYANTYMTNPIQLKFDVAVDWGGNSVTRDEEWAKYNFRSGMMGAIMICGSTSPFNEVEEEVAKQTYKLYNEKQREILRRGDVYHVLDMPDGVHWDGMEFYNSEIGKGSLIVFRPSHADDEEKTIKLDGLDAKATYLVEFEDRDYLNTMMTGKQLMEEGVTILDMDQKYDSEIVWFTKQTVPAASVEIAPEKFEIGETKQLKATVLPAEAEQDVTWKVYSLTGEGTITEDGVFTATKAGVVVLQATVKSDSSIYAYLPIEITKPAPISISKLKVKLAATLYTYDGKVKKPAVTVTDAKGKKIASSNYTVKYASGRKLPGTYTVKVTMKGSYTGSKTLTFAIRGKQMAVSKLTALSKGFKATWKRQSYVTGYQVQYSTSSKFMAKTTKTATISKNTTVSKTVTKLKAKTKYYVRVRSYKTTKISGKSYNVYSAWSKAKAVTTKK